MHDAFKPSEENEPRRRRLWDYLTQPSRSEVRDAEDTIGQAKAFLEWSSMPYHTEFLRWMSKEATKPIEGTAHMDLLVGTTRANTFKEILSKLDGLRSRAEMALGD